MSNPYLAQPDFAFWRRAVERISLDQFDPVVDVPFEISPDDEVATSGSCFAQHISRHLTRQGFNYLVTEPSPRSPGAENEGYGVFPARFGNVYTVRQLLQLFQRTYGLFEPAEQCWRRDDGAFIDPF